MIVCLLCTPVLAETSREPLALNQPSAVFANALSGFALSKDGSLPRVFLELKSYNAIWLGGKKQSSTVISLSLCSGSAI